MGDFQLFTIFLHITIGEKSIERTIDFLQRKNVMVLVHLRKSLVSCLLRVNRNIVYNQNKLFLIHALFTRLNVRQYEYSGYLSENPKIIAAFFNYGEKEKELFH